MYSEFVTSTHVFLIILAVAVNAEIKLICAGNGDTRHCADQQIKYQCILYGNKVALRWRVYDDNSNDSHIGQKTYISNQTTNSPASISTANDFSTVLLSNGNPLISNISFTANTSQNGYRIECGQVGGESEECTVIIAGTQC